MDIKTKQRCTDFTPDDLINIKLNQNKDEKISRQ
jgi:hypothetical protein